MNKRQIQYAKNKVDQVGQSKLLVNKTTRPLLASYLNNALIEKQVKLKNASEIISMARERAIASIGAYSRHPSFEISELFQEPKEYKEAQKAYLKEQKRVDELNKPVREAVEIIADKLEMGLYETGAEAIQEAHSIKKASE